MNQAQRRKKIKVIGIGLFLALAFFMLGRAFFSETPLEVVFVGESTTFLGKDKSYPSLTMAMLEKARGRPLAWKNLAISGTSTSVLLSRVREQLAKEVPRVLVVMMGVNDTQNEELKQWQRLGPLAPDPKNPWPLFDFYQAQGEPLAALKWVGPMPRELKRSQKLCQLFAHYHWPDKARFYCFEGAKLFPQEAAFFYRTLMWMLVEAGNASESRAFIEEAWTKFPHEDSWGIALSWVEAEERHFNLALEALESAKKKAAPTSLWFESLAGLYADFNQYTEAITVLLEAQKIRPGNFFIESKLFALYAQSAQRELAFNQLRSMKKNLPQYQVSFDWMEQIFLQDSPQFKNDLDPLWELTGPMTKENWKKLVQLVRQSGAQLVIMGYPFQNLAPLQNFLREAGESALFLENRDNFLGALKTQSYADLFIDNFAGFFGHFTQRSHQLIATSLTNTLEKILP